MLVEAIVLALSPSLDGLLTQPQRASMYGCQREQQSVVPSVVYRKQVQAHHPGGNVKLRCAAPNLHIRKGSAAVALQGCGTMPVLPSSSQEFSLVNKVTVLTASKAKLLQISSKNFVPL